MEGLQLNTGGGQLPGRTIEEISADIRMRVQHMARDYIAIGRDLIDAKAILGHGKFLPYLQEMGFGVSAADKWMRLASEIDLDSPLAELPQAKAMALIGLPAAEREPFARENDIDNKSAAEIKRLIRERDAAQRAAQEAEERTRSVARELERERDKEPRTVTVHEVPDDYQQLKMTAAHQAADLQEAITAAEEAERRAADAEAEIARMRREGTGEADTFTRIQGAVNTFLIAVQMLPYDRAEISGLYNSQRYAALMRPVFDWAEEMREALEGRAVDAEGAVL